MVRIAGDKNLSAREQRKDRQIDALKLEVETQKAKTKVAQARSTELRETIKNLSKQVKQKLS
ncbi:hypothetical protein [Rhodoferax sp.]|uniref:hypothetical protein n=1 Tax=Rhodoferax sp. TaxID=50421 RepID=UPI0027196095|nr:hypothetical protein [Rhodoferax sp.]MDO8320952.1 hypothetical protein [Rhodoferax sp.]